MESLDFEISIAYDGSLVTTLMQIMEARSRYYIRRALSSFQKQLASGLPEEDAFTEIGVELCTCAEFHSHLLVARSFASGVASVEDDHQSLLDYDEISVLRLLVLLHMTQRILEDSGSFLLAGAAPMSLMDALSNFQSSLINSTAPHVLNLVEAYQFSDKRLGSVLGRSDGNVYPSIMEASRAEPLNHGKAAEGQKYILQMLHSKNMGNRKSTSPKPRL